MTGQTDAALIRAAIERHWAASDAGDDQGEYAIYADDTELEYPQSGERFAGRANVQASRGAHPARRRFRLVRLFGSGELWVSEVVISYDGKPFDVVSIMQFAAGKVTHETQYFTEPFEAPAWRASWRSSV
jgi:ketosteroid isomerase-like protein